MWHLSMLPTTAYPRTLNCISANKCFFSRNASNYTYFDLIIEMTLNDISLQKVSGPDQLLL